MKFTKYEGDTPVCWNWAENPKMYYLEADNTDIVSALLYFFCEAGVVCVDHVTR